MCKYHFEAGSDAEIGQVLKTVNKIYGIILNKFLFDQFTFIGE